MKYLVSKYPIRINALLELACLYFICFALAGLLAFVEHASAESFVMLRYLKFLIVHQTIFAICMSMIVLVYHYQGVVKLGAEVYCRIIVGDRLKMIRIRYSLACLGVLIACFLISFMLAQALTIKTLNMYYLLIIFIVYIGVSVFFIGFRRAK